MFLAPEALAPHIVPHVNLVWRVISGVGQKNAEEQKYFDEFYEEVCYSSSLCSINILLLQVFSELESAYGPIDEMVVCENIGEHMVGNVYIRFESEEDAERAHKGLDNRW